MLTSTLLWRSTNRILRRIARALEARHPTLGLALSSVIGRRIAVSVVPPIELVDVEKVLLSIAPKDEDGQSVVTGPFSWTVDATAVLTLQPAADGLSCWAISGIPGVAIVSVSDGTLTDTIQVTVKTGASSSLNLSAGTPVHE
jgi:hypothetical protein